MARLNADDGEREFQINIIISRDGPSRVIAMERGEGSQLNRTTAETPLGDILGLRECLRLGGLMTRQFFATKQRALDLRAKREALLAKQRHKPVAPPPEAPEVTLAPITGPLVDENTLPSYDGVSTVAVDKAIEEWAASRVAADVVEEVSIAPEGDQSMPWCEWCQCWHHDTAPCITKDGFANPARVAVTVVDQLIQDAEQYVGPLTDEQKQVAHEVVRDAFLEPSAKAAELLEAVATAAEESLTDTRALLEGVAVVPGLTHCIECEKPLVVVDNVATCVNQQCSYYDDAAAMRVNRGSTRVEQPPKKKGGKRGNNTASAPR